MSKHTPGPWHIQQGDSGETFIKPIPGQVVAVIEPQANSETEKDNARLIAAAPEMYSLLERLRDAPDGDAYLDMHNEIGALLDMIEVAQNDQ